METGIIIIQLGLTRQLVINCEAGWIFVRSVPKQATILRMRDLFITMKKLPDCPDCEKLFRAKMDLSNNVHDEKQEYKCNHCEEVFSKRSNLKRHIDGLEESNFPDNCNSGSNNKVV